MARRSNHDTIVARESVLLKQVRQWLTLHKILHWRSNCGSMKIGGRYVQFGEPGIPDLLCVISASLIPSKAGVLLGIETKSASGRLSEAQRAVHANLRAAGAVVLVVRSIDELEAGLRTAGWKE